MTARSMPGRGGGYLERPSPSGLAEVITAILDKGLAIDAYTRVSLLGVELLTVDARVVVASVDTYLRFAEATNRLDLYEHGGKDITDLTNGADALVEKGAHEVTTRAVTGAVDKVKDKIDEKVGQAEEKVKEVVGVDDSDGE